MRGAEGGAAGQVGDDTRAPDGDGMVTGGTHEMDGVAEGVRESAVTGIRVKVEVGIGNSTSRREGDERAARGEET